MKFSEHALGPILIALLVIEFPSVTLAAEDLCTRGYAIRPGNVEDRAIGQSESFVWMIEQRTETLNGEASAAYFVELVARRPDGVALRFPFSEPQILDTVRGPNNEIRYRYRYDLHLEAKKKHGGIFSFWKTFVDAVPVYHRGWVRAGQEKRGDSIRIGRLKEKLIDNYTFLVDPTPSHPAKQMTFNFWRIKPDERVEFEIDDQFKQACIAF